MSPRLKLSVIVSGGVPVVSKGVKADSGVAGDSGKILVSSPSVDVSDADSSLPSPSLSSATYSRPRAPSPPSRPSVLLPSICPAYSPQDSFPYMHRLPLPSLSSPASSSARSSAYASSGSALPSADYPHIHVAGRDDDLPDIIPLPPKSSPDHSHPPSISNFFSHEHPPIPHEHRSYDMSWQPDERDEAPVISDDETDDEALLDHDPLQDHLADERTSAAVIADEGRGLIVQAGTTPLITLQNQVPPGTTHLLLGTSTTPNAMPAFLTLVLPQISRTLLALDISANFLNALPPVLAICEFLEELNVASNPLRVLPVFLADLVNLRVLIADSTGISTLPDALVDLDRLHTISIRRNKFLALPSWLCLLPALQTLCIDGNPFQGPWRALVEPLLSKVIMSPSYPPSTPVYPLSHEGDTETDASDMEDLSDNEIANVVPNASPRSPDEEDNTITPERAPFLGRAKTLPQQEMQAPPSSQSSARPLLARTRTTPNRSYYEQTRAKTSGAGDQHVPRASNTRSQEDSGYLGDRELRKMKSAGDLRRTKISSPDSGDIDIPFVRPSLSQYAGSHSYLNILNMNFPSDFQPPGKLFTSLGSPSSGLGTPPRPATGRASVSKSFWDNISENEDESSVSPRSARISMAPDATISPPKMPPLDFKDGKLSSREGKEKGSRWGFLKKMSMGKMKVESPTQSPIPPSRQVPMPRLPVDPSSSHVKPPEPTSDRSNRLPQIDMRFSTLGSLDALSTLMTPVSPPPVEKGLSRDASQSSLGPPLPPKDVGPGSQSPTLLVPPTRSSKRRSFLPVDVPDVINFSISDMPLSPDGLGASSSGETRRSIPSVSVDQDQFIRREEERAREAYMRALRSVMAYLRDMNDLGVSQQSNVASLYNTSEDTAPTRSRRPTGVDRDVSVALSGTTAVASLDSATHLRSSDSIGRKRSGTSSQTLSVATTDSNDSVEERKFKDDKGKRAMVIREIVLTERTYVQGLQELVDIYIKPAAVPVNILSGVGTTKDTAVPAPERKIVFGGLDALFSFHKDSFLPALEYAAAPLMKPATELQETDADGQLSIKVAKDVGNMFLKHAAFMRMYSSYINNFDNSVQRIKYWTSDRSMTGGVSLSPNSSTAQLASLGLAMSAVSNPSVLPESMPTNGAPNLTASQRKRIKSYLKRCRINPRHTQLNLEGYLLLPIQRIPRYRLLLEELLRSTPPSYDFTDDPLERALSEISSLANNMNEGKREFESRRKLVKWQARIKGKFPSPLVQPHRRLIMDGPLLLTRVVRKAMVSFEAINALGDQSTVQVDCLAPELTPRPLMGILCNDLLVLCRDPSDGKDPNSSVDLWAVLRMQTLPQPASIVHGNVLRLVDNKAILYFDAPSPSDALNWYRAINLHIPASKG
ncbi:hypothetical protein APHAL10511_006234 [Amanita phalloides]|nr:hypothetical protein APHAL10511_006234 [Amanita phalloides]